MALSKEQLLDLYDSEGSVSAVARALGVSRKVAATAMKRLGVEYDSTYRKYLLNHRFFSSAAESELQFYWAGFLAASANIVDGDSYRVELNVSVRDIDYIRQMMVDMDSTVPVRVFEVYIRGEKYREARTVISSKELVHDLARFHVLPKKKHTYVMPEWLLRHRLLRHFLRGWFDGVGGFYLWPDHLEFRTSGTPEFLSQYLSMLVKHAGVDENHGTILHDGDVSKLRIYSPVAGAKVAKYLYRKASRYRDNRADYFGIQMQVMALL